MHLSKRTCCRASPPNTEAGGGATMEEDKSSVLQEQSEVSHEHISALLKRRREEKGLSLQQTEAATRIPVHYLQHLEGGGDPRLLADELYLVPFLRTYATFLDLDPAYAVAEFV